MADDEGDDAKGVILNDRSSNMEPLRETGLVSREFKFVMGSATTVIPEQKFIYRNTVINVVKHFT